MGGNFTGSCDRGTMWSRAVAVAGVLAELGVTSLKVKCETDQAIVEHEFECRGTDLPGELVDFSDILKRVELTSTDGTIVVEWSTASVRWTCDAPDAAALFESRMPLG